MGSLPLNMTIVYGSYRENRNGIRAVRYCERLLEQRGQKPTFVDAKELDLPILQKRIFDYDEGKAPKKLQLVSKIFSKTDAFIIVAGEYNSGMQPGLKNLLDHFLPEYSHRPAGILTYSVGRVAGTRNGVHLRAVLSTMGMVTIPRLYAIGEITNMLDNEGNALSDRIDDGANKFLDEIEWYGQVMKSARASGIPS